ncbi:MAG: hypothetical protein ABI614_28565 [Planctomycetota bacterium]
MAWYDQFPRIVFRLEYPQRQVVCQSWKHSRIPKAAGAGQEVIAYGNGVFLCSFKDHVARSVDGGEMWTLHETRRLRFMKKSTQYGS